MIALKRPRAANASKQNKHLQRHMPAYTDLQIYL